VSDRTAGSVSGGQRPRHPQQNAATLRAGGRIEADIEGQLMGTGGLHSSSKAIYDRRLLPAFNVAGLVYFYAKTQNFSRFPITSNLYTHAWSIKYR